MDESESSVAVAIAVYSGGDPGGDSAALEGVLRDAGQCLVVETAEQRSFIPVFPDERASWDGERLYIKPGGGTEGQDMAVGDTISLGGGYREGAPPESDVPAGCPDNLEFFQVAR